MGQKKAENQKFSCGKAGDRETGNTLISQNRPLKRHREQKL